MRAALGMVAFALAAGLSWGWTWLVHRLAHRVGWLDQPNRLVPQHRAPVARPGGLGIALATVSALALIALMDRTSPLGATVVAPSRQLLATLSFLAVGLVDDWFRLRPAMKFALQLVAACGAVSAGVVFPLTSSPLLDQCIAVVWMLTLVNACNFLDVCDGLLAGLACLMLVYWSLTHPGQALFGLVAAGACAGFLGFNWPPARVFLGDAGSHWLAAVVAALTLTAAAPAGRWPHVLQALLVTGIPLFELCFVTLVRLHKRLPWWRGSSDHVALRLQAAGLTRLQTDLVVWSGAAVLLAVAAVLPHLPPVAQGLTLAAALGLLLVASRWLWRWEVTGQ